ncbi:MAG: xanthine dehydrogenase family protein molybdopterin-binding subunit [Planctomycetota bacterium]|nr:xanthine dehydrogenase family protein molybdopterin-binding subunit [Planctomycetota bacterium]
MARVVGSRLARPDGPGKVAGTTRYVADLHFAGEWVGGTVRANVARGLLEAIERDAAFDFTRVVVVGPQDVPGANVIEMLTLDQPALASREIEHFGEPLLLVAAPDEATLQAALAALRPRITPLEPVFDPRASTKVFKEIRIEKGDVESALAGATRTFEGEYESASQEQLYIEPQGVIALPPDENGVVTVHGSLQCPYYVQKTLVRALGLPAEKVRVVQEATGGGFGGKEDYPSILATHAALLARKAGRPVRMIYDRHEDLAFTPKRHPSRVRIRSGVDGEGRLLALDIDVLFDGGAYTTLSPVVLSRGCIHAAGPYRCEHVRIHGRAVATNHVPYGAFRGFGAPQTCFAIERHMDHIAAELGLHPFELRRRNALRLGDRTATGQLLKESVGAQAVLERIAQRTHIDTHPWRAPKTTRKRRGLGMSFFFHGAGFTGAGETMLHARIALELDAEGRALVRSASTEFGQGTETLFKAIAAEALGCEPDDVLVAQPDTHAVPNSGPTVASRTCMIVGGVLARAGRELAARIGGNGPFRERARAFVRSGGDSRVEATYQTPAGLEWDDKAYRGDAYPAYGWAADVAEVEVDLDTFDVRVVRFWSAVDCGTAIQPQLVVGQFEGGSLQAVGFAQLEVVTTRDGRFQQDRMATCIIPTALDAPDFTTDLVEVPFSGGPFGAKGVGEMPMDGGAPAVLAAIEDALGLHVTRIPATPEHLLELWLAAHPEERL